MSKLLETWYGCSQSNFAPCAPLVTAYLLADLILLINNNQQSLSGLLTEVCAFVKFGRLSLEQHLDGELWQAWKWERLRKMGRSVCSVLLVFNWFTRWVRWVSCGVCLLCVLVTRSRACRAFYMKHAPLQNKTCSRERWGLLLFGGQWAQSTGARKEWRGTCKTRWISCHVAHVDIRWHQGREIPIVFCFHLHPLAPKAMTGRFITQCLQIFNAQA